MTLNLHHIQTFHKVFAGIVPRQTCVKQVILEVDVMGIANFTDNMIKLLDGIHQFRTIILKVLFCSSYINAENVQIVTNNLEKMLALMKVDCICFELKQESSIPNIIGILMKGIMQNVRIRNLTLHGLYVQDLECLASALIEWSSRINLVILSIKACCGQGECVNFLRMLSEFLAGNKSLIEIDIDLPLNNIDVLKCDMSGLDINCTLERLTVGKVIYKRISGRMHCDRSEAVRSATAPILERAREEWSVDTPWVTITDSWSEPPVSHLLMWSKEYRKCNSTWKLGKSK